MKKIIHDFSIWHSVGKTTISSSHATCHQSHTIYGFSMMLWTRQTLLKFGIANSYQEHIKRVHVPMFICGVLVQLRQIHYNWAYNWSQIMQDNILDCADMVDSYNNDNDNNKKKFISNFRPRGQTRLQLWERNPERGIPTTKSQYNYKDGIMIWFH